MKRAVISLIVMGLATAPAFSRGDGYEPGVVVVGVFGNVLGGIAGGLLGARMSRDEHGALPPAAIGALAGSVIGSSLAVHWAAARRGGLGMAVLGAVAGELAAVTALSVLGGTDDLGLAALIPFVVLPPLGAAILHGRSWSGRAIRGDSGLVRLAGGRLGLGMPGFAVHPVRTPGFKAGAAWRCDVRLLSVEL
ncbi:MAG TPA: glycine zipper 2TM domain-containing protein [Candidatus Aminicenantes bacterium]|nr:glycine zipper 2TM domain-containing protein [Candidatus Aminicenantes bacterium]